MQVAARLIENRRPSQMQIPRIRPAIPRVIRTKRSIGRVNGTRLPVIAFTFCWKVAISIKEQGELHWPAGTDLGRG